MANKNGLTLLEAIKQLRAVDEGLGDFDIFAEHSPEEIIKHSKECAEEHFKQGDDSWYRYLSGRLKNHPQA